MGNIYKAWFVAPSTTRYRFYMTCDDLCSIAINNETAGSSEAPTQLLRNAGWNQRRDWWEANVNPHLKRISDWVDLEEGQHYYLQGYHVDRNGGDHYSVAVEIEATEDSLEGHHHSMKELQFLSVGPEQIFDTTKVTI